MNPWILAIRPNTLPATIGPLLVGNVLAFQLVQFSWFIAVISMLCAVLLQITVNLANDYFDYKSGVDTDERLGPVRATQSGQLTPKAVRNAMILCLLLALFVGTLLIIHGGWPIAVLAIAAVLAALGYSAGPYPLASHGLGEVAAFVFFGLIAVVGSYFLQAGYTNTNAWLLGAAIGFLNAAIMLVNNTRDMETDAKAGKMTLAVRLGLAQSRIFYQSFVYLPFAIIITGFLMGMLSGTPVLLAGLAFIPARNLCHDFNEVIGAELNPLLARTAKLTLLYSGLFSLGVIIDLLLAR
ncbi:1,4-dihydroxy-2-naphthoate polyprenyltransferase [Shewanella sp.]|nr:1,4-dihydroxy-2-naphthoate polyprenyltransferase [Shewanella sp.]